MKTNTLLASAIIGLFLGTSVAVASASSEPTSAPVAHVSGDHGVTTSPSVELTVEAPRVINVPEVTIVGTWHRAKVRAKTWTCGGWQESAAGGKYKACEWK